jgi:hypothetical protein
MRKLLAVLALFSLTLWGAGFWEKKKFTEWSDKETDKILKDSPWAHSVDVPMGGGRPGGGMESGGGGGGRKKGGGGGGMGNIADASNAGGGGGGEFGGGRAGTGGGGDLAAGGGAPTMSIMVRWHTALPVKQALARMRFGAEATTSAEAAKVLAPEDRYVIGVGPLPAQMLRGDAAALKSGATLSIKGKDPIVASDIKGDRQGNAANLYLIFPKTQPITAEDNEVEFAFKLNALNIKRKFKLKEMMYEGKLEL